MKKLILLLSVCLFCGITAAEEAKVTEYDIEDPVIILYEEKEPEPEPGPEKEPEVQQEKEPEVEKQEEEVAPGNKEKPEFFYFQPLLEGIVGIFSEIGLGFDIGFHVASTDVAHIYAGFSARAATYVGDANMDLLLLPKLDFNFKLKNKYLDWIAFWFGIGAEFYFMQSMVCSVDQNGYCIPFFGDDESYINNFDVSGLPAWGIGVDLIFKNYMVLKLGVSTFALMYPELMLGLGYRF